jgi:hypothetical protein
VNQTRCRLKTYAEIILFHGISFYLFMGCCDLILLLWIITFTVNILVWSFATIGGVQGLGACVTLETLLVPWLKHSGKGEIRKENINHKFVCLGLCVRVWKQTRVHGGQSKSQMNCSECKNIRESKGKGDVTFLGDCSIGVSTTLYLALLPQSLQYRRQPHK